MGKLLFVVAIIMIAVWAVEFLYYHVGGFMHILPAIAIILLIIMLLYNKTLKQ